MSNNKFYTPDGFTDQLPEICAFKREAEGKLREVFTGAGYREIETPGIEYCDIYTSTDLVDAEDLFKFCDQKGRLLCTRYDGTVPAVRFAANLYKDEPLPAITVLPGKDGSKGYGAAAIKNAMERAIGADIL